MTRRRLSQRFRPERRGSIGALMGLALLAIVTPAQAGRPLVVDDVDPVEGGRVQLEAGGEWQTASRTDTVAAPLALTLGIGGWLEVGVGSGVVYVSDPDASPRRAAGVGDVVLTAKMKLPAAPLGVELALAPALKLPTADDRRGLGSGEVDGGVTLIATTKITEDIAVHLNVGYTFIGRTPGADLRDVLFVGLAGEIPARILEDRLRLVGEVFATTKTEKDGREDVQARLGLRYLVQPDVVLDVALGRSLTRDPRVELFVTAGVTWVFDAPWR
jgi:hypothetical protein